MFKSQIGTFTKTSFGQSLFKSQVGTIVKFCCRLSDRDPNCDIQESLRCKFFEKISGLIISLIQIPDSFLHLFLTFLDSSRELTRVVWCFRSHLGQFTPKQTRFNLGRSSICSKTVKVTRSYHKGLVLKRKRLISIVIQINRMNNHWKTITSK